MRPDTLFWIASQSKSITAAAFMMMVDDTSGLPFGSAMEQPTLDLLPLREAAASYAMTALDFEPSNNYQYSNAGINTAGRIIEVTTGLRFEDFLDQRLLRPLGMKDTTFWPNARQIARLAASYKPSADGKKLEETTVTQLRYPLSDRTRRPMPAGGLFSTAVDVSRFCRMILRGGELDGRRYLSESAVREMTSRQTDREPPESYGLGWRVTAEGFGHGGAYWTDMTIDPARGRVMVYLVQHAGVPDGGEKCLPAFMAAVLA
jgi:CubicO group peptidase (beta-lactamase class C family)